MPRRAVVVGAGIGGLCTAVGLRRGGWAVTVLERWPAVVGVGAALGLWPQARDGLHQLGLGEAVEAASVTAPAAAIYRADGRQLVRIGSGRQGPDVQLISRKLLMDILLEAAHGIEIRTGVTADRDVLRVADPDLIVGADGIHSTVRTLHFPGDTQPRYTGMVAWRGVVDFEAPALGETWGSGMLFGHTPVQPGQTNFYAAVPSPEHHPVGFDQVRDLLRGWRHPIPQIVNAAREEDIFCHPIYDLHPALDSYAAGNVALIGDAAHAMTPNLGRGACEAVTDATALVQCLDSQGVPAALRAYDRQRRRASQKIARRSRQVLALARTRRLASLRDATLQLAGRALA